MRNSKIISLYKLIVVYLIGVIISIVSFLILKSISIVRFNLFIGLLFGIILMYGLIMVIKSSYKYSYSLSMMHWMFLFIFIGVSGLAQYLSNEFVYGLTITDYELYYVLLMILFWIIAFYAGNKYKESRINYKSKIYKILTNKLIYSFSSMLVFTIISIGVSVYLLTQGGFYALFSRSTASVIFAGNSTSETLLTSAIFKNVVLYGFVISLANYKKHKKGMFLLIIQAICVFITNPIFGMARYNVAIAYMGLMVILFPSFKRNKRFLGIFFFALIILFPMINSFRRYTLFEISIRAAFLNTIDEISGNFLSGDYDAFSMIANTLDYIRSYGITWGRQLVGAFLFFIPRSIWTNKPLGSGYTVRFLQEAEHLNVSSPLIVEGLINFGFLGVPLFGFFIGILSAAVDKIYWSNELNGNEDSYIGLLYPFLLSMFFFMNRGDLMSTYSFTISHIFIFSLMFIINNSVLSRLK